MFASRSVPLCLCRNLRFTLFCHQIPPALLEVPPKRGLACLTSPNVKNVLKDPASTCCNSIRGYAKGKDKKKDKGKSKVAINENQLAEVVNVTSLKALMEKAVLQMEEDFVKHLSLRSTTGAIESVPVSLDGNEHTLQELAQIVRKNPKTIVINFATFPQAIPAALKALAKSGMNLNPQQDGTTLFIPIPKVTKEHREQLSKNAKQLFVKCKDAIRDAQLKVIKQVKKKDKVSEDLVKNVEQQITAIADQFIAQAESTLNKKQTELLGEK